MEKDHEQAWRTKLHDTIYESNTKAGKAFDVALLVFILASILVVMLDSTHLPHF
jgi:voltage-gated potassium channel